MLAAAAFVAALATGCAGHPLSENVAATSRPTAAAQQAAATGTPAAAPAATPTSPAATPTSPAQPSTAAPGNTRPHFDTPQAAMIYLAHAYNTWDVTALHNVTEPRAFARLVDMRSDAFNLRLKYCTANPRGDFTCYFRHDFPVSEHKTGYGQAVFIAAPALTPGWYMYQFQSCD
jgi:predicted lipid-binding transport protein (Tim44 family)